MRGQIGFENRSKIGIARFNLEIILTFNYTG